MLRYVLPDFLNRVKRKILRKSRTRSYRAKTAPFLHRGEKGLIFELFPDEYIDGIIHSEGLFELYPLRWTGRHVRGRTFVDVGANIGNHTLYLAEYFDEVHCFEPFAPVADRLEANIARNRLSAQVHRVGLGAADDDLPFVPNRTGNLGQGSFAVAVAGGEGEVLPVREGDRYFRERGIRNVDLLKIDVEGFELQVLAGLKATIARDRPTIILEFDGREQDASALCDLLPDYVIEELRGKVPRPWVIEHRFYNHLLARPAEQIR